MSIKTNKEKLWCWCEDEEHRMKTIPSRQDVDFIGLERREAVSPQNKIVCRTTIK